MVSAADRLRSGVDWESTLADARSRLDAAGFAVDYLELRNAETLAPVKDARAEPLRMLAAARLGRTRLIDNIAV
jgi:pantoate--beta-alanine ligase